MWKSVLKNKDEKYKKINKQIQEQIKNVSKLQLLNAKCREIQYKNRELHEKEPILQQYEQK